MIPRSLLTRRLMSSTVNPKEVEKFRSMDWWGPKCAPLKSMNRLRVPWIVENSGGFRPGVTRILDVGCGGGILSEPLARLQGLVTGLDVVQENIHSASSRLNPQMKKNLTYVHSSIEDFALKTDPKFDIVVASEVIEHVENPSIFISHCASLLKESGSLYISTINRTPQSWLGAIVAAEYMCGLLPRGTHDWNKFLKPKEVEDALTKAGLRVQSVQGMMYIPYWNKWRWISDTSINYGIHAIKESSSEVNL
ncbi:ubiquinone biosynthesis O-methyltransferase, mitochondrial [Lepeophtheirus salmonis]|uniref:ubiquinone biosynthesis O-methyltransferase, mitochondrial n=1 Tax=Lepeophtheirus salmonis TaxID=72036 RepID=UPI003AF38373